MASTGLEGPFNLTTKGVNDAVKRRSAGAYALGIITERGKFRVQYVGRSDNDVGDRLLKHVPEKYTSFKFGYYPSAKTAFQKECTLYHDFDPVDNDIHPDHPEDADWECPECDVFDDD